jgi:hypothetical protein
MPRALRLLAILAIGLSPCHADADGVVALETVAVSGTVAPGLVLPFQGFSMPRIDAAGRIAFRAFHASDPDPFVGEEAVWLWSAIGEPALATRFAAPPDVPARLVSLDTLILTARGVTLAGDLAHENGVDFASDRAIWEGEAGALELLARTGDPAPVEARRLVTLSAVAGDLATALHAGLADTQSGAGVGYGLFRRPHEEALETVALEGAEGPEAGMVWDMLRSVRVDPAGRLAVSAQVDEAGLVRFHLLAPDGDEGFRVLARQGDPAPGTGTVFNALNLERWSLNGAGEVAFIADRATGVGDGERAGVWGSDEAGGLRLLARQGEPAPGSGGAAFHSFVDLALTSDGSAVFSAIEEPGAPGPPTGLWAAAPAGPTARVARLGDDVGVAGAVLERIDAFAPIAGGRVFVQGGARRLADDEILDGLWIGSLAEGFLAPLLIEGDRIPIAGVERTLADFGPFARALEIADTVSGGEDGKGPGANDAGQVAVIARYRDDIGVGSAVLRITVPGPGGGGLVALASLAALRWRRARR